MSKGEGYSAVVRRVVYMGTRIDYEVDCLDAKLGISIDSNHLYAQGDVLYFRLVPGKMWAVRCDDKSICDNRVVWGPGVPGQDGQSGYLERSASEMNASRPGSDAITDRMDIRARGRRKCLRPVLMRRCDPS